MNEFILILTLISGTGDVIVHTTRTDSAEACVVAARGWAGQIKEANEQYPELKLVPIVACTPAKVLPKVPEKTETL